MGRVVTYTRIYAPAWGARRCSALGRRGRCRLPVARSTRPKGRGQKGAGRHTRNNSVLNFKTQSVPALHHACVGVRRHGVRSPTAYAAVSQTSALPALPCHTMTQHTFTDRYQTIPDHTIPSQTLYHTIRCTHRRCTGMPKRRVTSTHRHTGYRCLPCP